MTAGYVPHCAVRAKERYGLDLTWDDVNAIANRCADGEGRTGGKPDGTQFHMIIFADHVLWVVYKPGTVARNRRGMVVTIMPPTVALSAVKNGCRHKARRTGDYELRRRRWS
ncbi:hypothetical protein [Reyranella sp.]|uniref:hypothetical protein n=1 Tax=Reyranella sp. TaxID=1929291 RepID=UPI003D0FD503